MPLNAIVLAAGEGTRMKSRHPKVAHKLLDHPLVWWPVHAAREAGAERIIVVVGSHADEVRAIFDGQTDVEFVEQTERLGTGHAVRVVRDAIGAFEGPTVVLYGDGPLIKPETIRALVDETRANHNAMTLLTMVPPDPFGYGRIVRDDFGDPLAIVEQKDCTPEQAAITECNPGIYCFCGRRLTDNIDRIGNDNVQHEYYLTDMLGIYRELGEPVGSIPAEYEETLGVNSRSQLAEVTRIMQRRINDRLMAEGVTMLSPEQVWVGPEVKVDNDTELLPMTMLWGTTTVGQDCVVGPNVQLTNVVVEDGAHVAQAIQHDTTIKA